MKYLIALSVYSTQVIRVHARNPRYLLQHLKMNQRSTEASLTLWYSNALDQTRIQTSKRYCDKLHKREKMEMSSKLSYGQNLQTQWIPEQ